MPGWLRWTLRGVLAALAIVLAVMLVVRGMSPHDASAEEAPVSPVSPSPSETVEPSETPTPEPSETPSAPPSDPPSTPSDPGNTGGGGGGGAPSGPAKPTVVSFTPNPSSFACTPPGEGVFNSSQSVDVTISWRSTDAQHAWIGIDTADAEFSPYEEVATNMDGYTMTFFCPAPATRSLTLTLTGPGGKTSKTVTIRNTGYTG